MNNQLLEDVIERSNVASGAKPFFLVVATSRDGRIREEVLLFDDEEKAVEVERLLWLIYGRKSVSRISIWISELPLNLIEAIECVRQGKTVDERFQVDKWLDQLPPEPEKGGVPVSKSEHHANFIVAPGQQADKYRLDCRRQPEGEYTIPLKTIESPNDRFVVTECHEGVRYFAPLAIAAAKDGAE